MAVFDIECRSDGDLFGETHEVTAPDAAAARAALRRLLKLDNRYRVPRIVRTIERTSS